MRVPLDSVDPSKLSGPDVPVPGVYHFEVLNVEEEDPKTGCMYVDCEVLAGEPKDQAGKVHREYFSLKPTALGRVAQLAVVLGFTTEAEIKQQQAAGETPDWPFATKGIGRQFCGQLVAETYEGKTRNRLNFNIWAVDSPKAKGIPLNEGKLAECRRLIAMQDGNGAGGDDPFGKPAAAGPASDGNGNQSSQASGSSEPAAAPPWESPVADDLFG